MMATPQEIFTRTLAYIEENNDAALSLEELTKASGVSRFALIRLFSRLCGVTPMEYIRLRRLAGSIPQLMRGGRIIDIALDAGFEHEQSYIRAFRDAYRMTPARFRRQDQPVPIMDVPKLTGFTVSQSGMLGKPALLARPAFFMRGALKYYNYADNLLDGTPLTEGIASLKNNDYTAACRISPKNQFTHLYLIQEDAPGEKDYVTWSWPAGQWAQFQYIGLHPLDREGARRMRLMASLVAGTWFSERNERWDGQFIEHVEKSWLSEEYCEVELLCPVDIYPQD
jgi:AraC family transcriptional regulator